MNPQELYELEQAARALAKRFLYPYIKRGDSFESLKKSQMGMGCRKESVCIGGLMNEKSYSTDFIIVAKVDDREANAAFKLRDIFREVQGEIMTVRDLENFKLEPG